MKRRYSREMIERAEYLYCCCGHTQKAVAELTGVSTAEIKRWSAKFGWADKRGEIARAMIEIRRSTILLRKKLLEQCLESQDTREALAVLSMESIARKEDPEAGGGRGPLLTPEFLRRLDSDKEAAAAIERACRIRMILMSSDPGLLNATTVKGLKEAMDLVDEMRKRNDPDRGERRGGLTDEAAAEIRRKILGLPE